MKTKLLLLILIYSCGCTSFADSIITPSTTSGKSAIQSTNIIFSNTKEDENINSYSSAITELQNKISQSPSDYELYVPLIDLYLKSKQYDNAYEELTFLNNLAKRNKLNESTLNDLLMLEKSAEKLSKYNKNVDLNINLALINLILKNNKKAQNYLLSSSSSNKFIETYKEVFDTTENYNDAIILADRILNLDPDNIQLRKLKAVYLLQLNQKEGAKKELSVVTKANPSDEEVKYMLYNLLNEENAKEKDILKTLYPENNGKEDLSYKNLAELLLKNNNPQEAKILAQKLVKEYPENADGYILLSEIYMKEGNLKDCYDILKTVRDKADDNESIAKYNVMLAKLSDEPVKEADALMNNNLYSQALTVLESANQENLYVILGMARANYFLNNKQKAFELLNKAMSLYPDNPDVFYYFAYIFYQEKDLTSARNYISKSLKINPEHNFSLKLLDAVNKLEADKYINQITSAIELQNFDEAMRLVNKAISIDGKNSTLFFHKGLIYIAMNNYAAATAPLYKAIELDKNNILAYYYLGVAFDNLSEGQNALENYKKFVDYLPQDDYGQSEILNNAKLRIEKLSRQIN